MKSTSNQSVTRFALGTLVIGILTACGGAGGGGGVDIADGGIRGTGSSVGPVSGFGSVFVNGVRFDTEALNGHVEGDDGITAESELDEGMILRVDGEWRADGQGTANTVEYDDTLRGEVVVVEPWNPTTKTATLDIYGITVHIDNQTVIKGKSVTDLADNDFVRISAWRLLNDEYRASLVRVLSEPASDPFDSVSEIEIEGRVSNFDPDLCTFTIGNITVECDRNNTEFDGIELSGLSGNPYVEVEGDFNGNVLLAREIKKDDLRRYRRGDDDDIEFAGPVSASFNETENTFDINGQTVRVTGQTEFDDGLSAGDLEPDLLIQVEGSFLADGSVEADEISLREGDSEVEGRVTANEVDSGNQTFRIGGVLIQVTALTAIVSENDRDLELSQIGGPEEVEVSGIERVTADGNVYLEALKVEIDDELADGGFELVGRLQEIGVDSLRVLGVDIRINGDTEFDDTSREDLENRLESSQPLIEVEYIEPDGGGFLANEIELEEGDDN